jgi:hypothetical protein
MKYVITPVRSWYSFRYVVESPAALAAGIARCGYAGGILTDSGIVTGPTAKHFPEGLTRLIHTALSNFS